MQSPTIPTSQIVTVADAKLKADVLKMIGLYESVAGGSRTPTLISVKSNGQKGNTYYEDWTVLRGSQLVTYPVNFTASPKGGVNFGLDGAKRRVSGS